jgi:molecular chaperone DnaK
MALQRLKEAAEKAKIELSSLRQTEINQPFISMGANGQPLHMVMKLTRAKLESLVGDLIKKLDEALRRGPEGCGPRKGDIDEVVLVGGMTRMPKVIER